MLEEDHLGVSDEYIFKRKQNVFNHVLFILNYYLKGRKVLDEMRKTIESGKAVLGIELGSTRIKAVLIDQMGTVIETGGFDWENSLVDGIWTYSLEEVWTGIQACYKNLYDRVKEKYNIGISKLSAMGVSAMMHGYLPFDKDGNQLAEFRTWRNNTTGQAADALTELFQYNIPQRWSISHLYQAILNEEEHVKNISYLTTLAGYVHWKLTDEKVMGVGEASGMFPIDLNTKDFNQQMIEKFDLLIANNEYNWNLKGILPKVLVAGEDAGTLTDEGALLLDPSGNLQAGTKFCPPEGDAGTGMVATNSIAKKTGNVSAGTSAFAMVVLEKELSKVHKELDMVTTPTGDLVAMAHSNNCTSDINAWIEIFNQCLGVFGVKVTANELYKNLFEKALEGDDDCGDLMSYCFYSGEHGVGLTEGCPMFLHPANAKFNLANFMRVQLYTCFGAMKLGMDILTKEENVKIDKILAHGGIFKTKGVAQNILSAALEVPVVVMETAGEGGAWGIALLALHLDKKQGNETLEEFLNNTIFGKSEAVTVEPNENMIKGYEKFLGNYKKGLTIEQEAVNCLKK